MARSSSIVVFALSLGVFGCSSSSNPSAPLANGDAGAPDSQEPQETGNPFRLLVVDPFPQNIGVPIADATVVFDKPGGTRVEAKTGADGVATIPFVDWSKGKAAFTIVKDGFIAQSLVELDEAYVKLGLYKPQVAGNPPADFVYYALPRLSAFKAVTGAITGRQGTQVTISPTVRGESFQGPDPMYAARVEPGKPFSFIVLDWEPGGPDTLGVRGIQQTFHRWLRSDHQALTADATVDLALDSLAVLTPKKVNAKLVVPATSITLADTAGYMIVGAAEGPFYGAVTKSDVNVEGTAIDCVVEFVDVPIGAIHHTAHLFKPNNAGGSFLTKSGLPVEGETFDGFVEIPGAADDKHPLNTPFVVNATGLPEKGLVRLILEDIKGARWLVDAPYTATTFTVPAIDDTIKGAVGSQAKTARISVFYDADQDLNLYTKGATSAAFAVTY